MIARKILAFSVIAATWTLTMSGAAAQNIVIKTGPQGGVWYPVAAGMAGVLTEKAKMRVAVQAGGGISNAIQVARNEGQLGFTTSGAAKEVYDGAEGRPPEKDLRLFGVLYNQYYTLSVPANSPIKSVKDLKGRSLVTQRKGSSTEKNTHDVLEVYGLKYDDLSKANFPGSLNDAANQVKDRQVDAVSLL
ncbi:MAG: TAXI family TRAP transporter solute-binding subunit, partial [Pseudomonadota bacterium]